MMRFELRATPRLIQLIAQLERLTGQWERIYAAVPGILSDREKETISADAKAAFLLDATTTPEVTHFFGTREESAGAPAAQRLYQSFLDSYSTEFDLEFDSLLDFAADLIGESRAKLGTEIFRGQPTNFASPARFSEHLHTDEVVFPTVLPFLVEPRLRELISWTNEELRQEIYHPLIVIGVFHLLFLQIHPFKTANHRISLLCLSHLLRSAGYSFVDGASIAALFERRARIYFSSLRQAERTARGDWSSLAVWLEFFVESLLTEARRLLADIDVVDRELRLTTVQKQIIEIVRTHGSATRDKVAQESGINLNTIKYNLSVLAERGHLKREGGGRTTSYRLV